MKATYRATIIPACAAQCVLSMLGHRTAPTHDRAARAANLRQEPTAGNSAACASCCARSRQDRTISRADRLRAYERFV